MKALKIKKAFKTPRRLAQLVASRWCKMDAHRKKLNLIFEAFSDE